MRQGAGRNDVDAALGCCQERIGIDAARGFDDGPAVDLIDAGLHVGGTHVVEHDDVGAAGDGFLRLL